MTLRQIAQETLRVLQQGAYDGPEGRVELANEQAQAIAKTQVFTPEQLAGLPTGPHSGKTKVRVTEETTFAAGRRLVSEGLNPVVLNFASARHPGGGFLLGADAQEEALARASGLYPCLLAAPSYYQANRACRTCLYTHHVVYSPRVPVFRGDEDELLPMITLLSILTAPAVNAGALFPWQRRHIPEQMRTRIDYVLRLALHQQHEAVVLGAWGCGAFRHSPTDMAVWFAEALAGPFSGAFSHVVFAVPASHGPNHRAFQAMANHHFS